MLKFLIWCIFWIPLGISFWMVPVSWKLVNSLRHNGRVKVEGHAHFCQNEEKRVGRSARTGVFVLCLGHGEFHVYQITMNSETVGCNHWVNPDGMTLGYFEVALYNTSVFAGSLLLFFHSLHLNTLILWFLVFEMILKWYLASALSH